jgi:lipopolysaccharide export system protein LptC
MVEPALDPAKINRGAAQGGPATPATARASASYSRFVTAMRIVLPLVALVIVVLVIAWPQLGEKPKKFSLNVSKPTAHDSGGQQMIKAHFTGTDSAGHPFTVTADTAAQQKQLPDLIDMAFPKADMTMENGAWVALSAKKGVYDRKTEKLDLSENVTVFHDSGYKFRTSAAIVDLTTSSAEGSAPVTGQGPGGNLSAAGFRILERGKILVFTGKSRMALFPSANAKNPAAKK